MRMMQSIPAIKRAIYIRIYLNKNALADIRSISDMLKVDFDSSPEAIFTQSSTYAFDFIPTKQQSTFSLSTTALILKAAIGSLQPSSKSEVFSSLIRFCNRMNNRSL